MPRGTGTVRHWYCDVNNADKLINELKKKELDPKDLEDKIQKIKSHKKHYNGTIRLGKKIDAKEFTRRRYCPVVQMVIENKPSSPVKSGSQS